MKPIGEEMRSAFRRFPSGVAVVAAVEGADVAAIASGPLPFDARAEMRTRIALSGRAALETCQKLFAALGGSLLPQGTRIERQFRDLHAMASHFLLQPEIVAENYGRHLLGLELPPTARF